MKSGHKTNGQALKVYHWTLAITSPLPTPIPHLAPPHPHPSPRRPLLQKKNASEEAPLWVIARIFDCSRLK